uniref:Uncharacterized protein n=1 Tax=Equus caballus TaxID=9796 RepID=A0A9L0SLL4_HORSE
MRKTVKLMNELKELAKWRNIPRSWIGRPNIVKMSVLPNLIYRVSEMLIKIQENYFVAIDKLILKFIWRYKKPGIANSILKEVYKVGGVTLPDFKTYCKAIAIKTVWHW